MEVCKRRVGLEGKGNGKVLSYCVNNDYNKLYVLLDGKPHEIYEISCDESIQHYTQVPKCGEFKKITEGSLSNCHLLCKIRCQCESKKHTLFCYDNTIYIISIIEGKIIVINGHMSYRIIVPAIDGKGNLNIIKNEIYIQAKPNLIIKASLQNLKESIFDDREFVFTEIDFNHEVIGLQLIHCKNAFRRKEVFEVLGKEYKEDDVIAIYGKHYPIVYRSPNSWKKSEFVSAIPDTRNIESLCVNPLCEKYVLLSDSFGRIIVFDTINRFIVKTISAMREAQMCWINDNKFVVYSDFRKVLEIHSCTEQTRTSFLTFDKDDHVLVLGFRANRIVVLLNDDVYVLCFTN